MMQKISILFLFLLVTAVSTRAQQVIYNQTFEDTAHLFQDYVLANLDKGIPAETTMDTLESVPWFVDLTGFGNNHSAVATSRYEPAVAADDWFITPAIRIGKKSTLSYKSIAFTPGKTDTYEVYVSTTEQSVSGCQFNGPLGQFIPVAAGFQTNTIDLAAAGYANQYIFIGFRLNTQSGGDKIAIDDIKVTEDSTHFASLTFIVDMSNYIDDTLFNPRTDTVDVAGTFNNFDGTKHIMSIVPDSDSTQYSITIPGFLDGDRLEFKFRINSTWHDSIVEFPYGQPNRVWTIEPGKYTYTCFYNDDESSTFGIHENGLMDYVNVYPNPAQSIVTVDIPESIHNMLLISLTGSKILSRETITSNRIDLDVSDLPKGTYLLLFYTKQGFAGSKKLIKN